MIARRVSEEIRRDPKQEAGSNLFFFFGLNAVNLTTRSCYTLSVVVTIIGSNIVRA